MRELGTRCANLAFGARTRRFFYFPVLFLFTFFEFGFDAVLGELSSRPSADRPDPEEVVENRAARYSAAQAASLQAAQVPLGRNLATFNLALLIFGNFKVAMVFALE